LLEVEGVIGGIEVRGLSRAFHTTVRRPGLVGGLRSLVEAGAGAGTDSGHEAAAAAKKWKRLPA
jgi:hypothetical protein